MTASQQENFRQAYSSYSAEVLKSKEVFLQRKRQKRQEKVVGTPTTKFRKFGVSDAKQ
jgi:hypothetical protein